MSTWETQVKGWVGWGGCLGGGGGWLQVTAGGYLRKWRRDGCRAATPTDVAGPPPPLLPQPTSNAKHLGRAAFLAPICGFLTH